MKIITWNVNGLRAVLGKGAWSWIKAQAPDVVCLQEIKCRPNQLTNDHLMQMVGYGPCWNPAERPGYSGVATFSLTQPLEIIQGVGVPEFDLEGRVIRARYPGFWLFNIYFPSGQRDYGRVMFKLDFYRHLLEICKTMHAAGQQIILCGDFNTAHNEIDLHNPRGNRKTSGFLPEERAWVDQFLAAGFVDAFRAMYPTQVKYTWWSQWSTARQNNHGWRLDYYLVSAGLMPKVRDVIVHDAVTGSDHAPVELQIED